MTTTDALNTTGAKAYIYPEMKVYLGDSSGNPPPAVSPTVFSNVYCSRVVQSASGSRMDYAELTWALSSSLINRTQPANFARMVSVRLPTAGSETFVHLGDYVRESLRIDQSGETLTAQSQWRPYHYGDPLTHYTCIKPDTGSGGPEYAKIFDDVVFNPIVDGVIKGNRSDQKNILDIYYWCHPECADTTAGQTSLGQVRSMWTLTDAVEAICFLLVGSPGFVRRPNSTDLATVLAGAPTLQNVTIPLGTRMHQALDMLLIPLGYNWYLNYEMLPYPEITVFKIGSGAVRDLYLQAPGSSLNLKYSNINQLAVDNAIGDAFNQVTILGDFERVEVTVPLYAGWDSSGDSFLPSNLRKDGSDYADHQTAWRLFIANEAGDIDPTVSRFGQLPEIPALESLFDLEINYFPHRRTMDEPLTLASGTGQPQRLPHLLEYSVDSGDNWRPAEESWSFKLCPDQIGVYFDGMDIPQELHDAGNSWRMRITGTIAGDSRIQSTATKTTNAVNGRVFEQVFVMPEKFVRRWRHVTGYYASKLETLDNTADEQDDQDAIDAYAVAMRNQNHFAEIDCEFRLPGWHTYYQIGDIITKIAGREISLNGAPVGSSVQRYVQIVERRFEMGPEGPSTVLIVDRGTA